MSDNIRFIKPLEVKVSSTVTLIQENLPCQLTADWYVDDIYLMKNSAYNAFISYVVELKQLTKWKLEEQIF